MKTYKPYAKHTAAMGSEEIREFNGLHINPLINLFSLSRDRFFEPKDQHPAFVLFTDVVHRTNGLGFFNFLEAHPEYGRVFKSDTRVNPNSNNELDIFVFIPNDRNLMKYYLAEKVNYDSQHAAWNAKKPGERSFFFVYSPGVFAGQSNTHKAVFNKFVAIITGKLISLRS